MSLNAFMTILGENNDLITKNALNIDGIRSRSQEIYEIHKDSFPIIAFHHIIEIPYDQHTGLPSGQRIHNPISITKLFDKSSPRLYISLARGEKLRECNIKWYTLDDYRSYEQGSKHYFSHILEDAMITKISYDMPKVQHVQLDGDHHFETLEISYRKLRLIHEISNIQGADYWAEPNSWELSGSF